MKQKHHIRYDQTPDMLSAPKAPQAAVNRTVRIEFDGGTPCNIPRLGYGIGYGSYRIDGEPIVRLDHRAPMSANAAELLTLVRAVQAVASRFGKEGVALSIHAVLLFALSSRLP